MQKMAWMTRTLFNKWINHFLLHTSKLYGIYNENQYLPIMDGHDSCVTTNVAHSSQKIGLDVLTIPNHTSHAT
jgi:hypothetical protein